MVYARVSTIFDERDRMYIYVITYYYYSHEPLKRAPLFLERSISIRLYVTRRIIAYIYIYIVLYWVKTLWLSKILGAHSTFIFRLFIHPFIVSIVSLVSFAFRVMRIIRLNTALEETKWKQLLPDWIKLEQMYII